MKTPTGYCYGLYDARGNLVVRVDPDGPTYVPTARGNTDRVTFDHDFAQTLAHNIDSHNALVDFVAGIRDMVTSGRLIEADIPDDFAWLRTNLAYLATLAP